MSKVICAAILLSSLIGSQAFADGIAPPAPPAPGNNGNTGSFNGNQQGNANYGVGQGSGGGKGVFNGNQNGNANYGVGSLNGKH